MAIVLFFIRTVAFLFAKNLKGMNDMYFTDTPELRKFEREMRQKPNFDKRNDDCDENKTHISLMTKISILTEKRKRSIDCMKIKIRIPTKGYC